MVASVAVSEPDATEVIYEHPAPPARRWVIVAGGVLFVALALWVTARALPGPRWIVAVAAVGLAVVAVQSYFGGKAVLATRRVTADPAARTLRIVHRRGERVVAFGDVAGATHGRVVESDGVTLDAVTLTLRGGESVVFGVASPETAEGAARAIRALTGEGSEAGVEAGAQAP